MDNDVSTWTFPFSEGWKTGLEPATFGTTIRRSNQLSYNHHICFAVQRYSLFPFLQYFLVKLLHQKREKAQRDIPLRFLIKFRI